MFQFLQGWLWVFGVAAALPVVLHLLSRQRLRKIPFSSLMLIARLEKSQMRRLRLRQLLLLILRTLAILMLVVAFTRPLLTGSNASVLGDQETAAVIVIDQSASMSALGEGGRRIDRARGVVRSIMESFQPGDRVAFMADTGQTAPPRFLQSRDDRSAALDSVMADDGRAELGKAVESGLRVLDSLPSGSKELYVVTDGHLASWGTVPESDVPGTRVYLAVVEDDMQPNRSIKRIDFGSSLWVANSPLQVTAMIANSGSDIRALPVSLFLDGNRVAQETVDIADGDSSLVTLGVASLSAGWHYGRVEISSDAWPNDNEIYFALEAAPSLPVLVVGDNREVVRPVMAALRPKPETRTPFAPEAVSTSALASEIDPRFGLTVIAGVNALPSGSWDRVLRYVENGGGLWVLMDPNNDAGNYSEYLLRPLWNTDLKARVLAIPGGSFVTLQRPLRHAMFSYLEEAEAYPEIRFGGSAKLGPVDRNFVLQRFSDGSPALIEAKHGKGRLVLFTGYADPRQSDLVYHPLFVPQVQATATYLARRGTVGDRPYYTVGDHAAGPAVSSGTWSWVTPETDTMSLVGGPIELPVMRAAGVYRLLNDGQSARYYAANVDAGEFELDAVEDWHDIWGDRPYTLLAADGSVNDQISEARVGVDLWRPALVLALLLLVAEMLVAWPRKSERI